MNDQAFMELALAEARLAAKLGEVPVGAVVVRQGRVIATGRNGPVGGHDPTAHAEIVALRAAAIALGNYRLDDCELFVTLEPCAMCSGAMLNARLKRVVFGAPEPKTGAAGSVLNLFANESLNHQTLLHGGVLTEASRGLMQDFFRQRRADRREVARKRHPLRDDALRTPDAAFEGLPGYPWPPHYVSDLPALAGLRMHYLDEHLPSRKGAAPGRTYLCLHDGASWSYVFRRLIPQLLEGGHRVIAPDLIGFGKSDKPKKETFHTFEQHREILLQWIEALDLYNVVLVLSEADSVLGLTLPMAAPWRYGGLRFLNTKTLAATDDLPLSDGWQAWEKSGARSKAQKVEEACCTQSSAELHALDDSPFPAKSFRMAIHRLQFMLAVPMEDGNTIKVDAEKFWQHCLANKPTRTL